MHNRLCIFDPAIGEAGGLRVAQGRRAGLPIDSDFLAALRLQKRKKSCEIWS
jgi:hypothetical protein